MKFLGVDTTNKCAKIILACDGDIKTTSLGENEKQSENLMNRIDEFLRENDMKIKDINCFGVVAGSVAKAIVVAPLCSGIRPVVVFTVAQRIGKGTESGRKR